MRRLNRKWKERMLLRTLEKINKPWIRLMSTGWILIIILLFCTVRIFLIKIREECCILCSYCNMTDSLYSHMFLKFLMNVSINFWCFSINISINFLKCFLTEDIIIIIISSHKEIQKIHQLHCSLLCWISWHYLHWEHFYYWEHLSLQWICICTTTTIIIVSIIKTVNLIISSDLCRLCCIMSKKELKTNQLIMNMSHRDFKHSDQNSITNHTW